MPSPQWLGGLQAARVSGALLEPLMRLHSFRRKFLLFPVQDKVGTKHGRGWHLSQSNVARGTRLGAEGDTSDIQTKFGATSRCVSREKKALCGQHKPPTVALGRHEVILRLSHSVSPPRGRFSPLQVPRDRMGNKSNIGNAAVG